MGGFDLLAIVAYIFLVFLAKQRGAIIELTEALALLIGAAISLRMYRGLGAKIQGSLLTGFSVGFVEKTVLLLLFVLLFLVVFSLGLTLQRRLKEEKVLAKEVDERVGIAVGLGKAAWFITLGLGLIFYFDGIPQRDQQSVRNGPIVSLFLGLDTVFSPTISIMAPEDLAKEFRASLAGTTPSGSSSR